MTFRQAQLIAAEMNKHDHGVSLCEGYYAKTPRKRLIPAICCDKESISSIGYYAGIVGVPANEIPCRLKLTGSGQYSFLVVSQSSMIDKTLCLGHLD